MAPLRGYLLPGGAAIAGLLLVMIGLSAPPAEPCRVGAAPTDSDPRRLGPRGGRRTPP